MVFIITPLVLFGLVIFIARSLPECSANNWRLTKFLDSYSPLLIGLVWLIYGALHIAYPESAMVQMPAFMGRWRYPIFSASGGLEIGLGLLTISTRWRKLALLCQLYLLFAFTPFVIFLLIDDKAIIDLLGNQLPLGFARLLLIFHNILLWLWIYRTYHRTSLPHNKSRTLQAPSATLSKPPAVLVVAVILLLANTAGFIAIFTAPWSPALPAMWAMACLATGSLVGFIFGVPKWIRPKSANDERARYEPNANIEKLSDWLTKIIVGVGLVELHRVGPAIVGTSEAFAQGATLRSGGVVPIAEAQAFASAVIVYFFAAGVIEGFLLTRMFLTRAWQADK